ncbi:RES family NAD+ phosphorylase [Extensimonas vulgaris]|jgi:RES domain-containing protein|uniref:RES domain-containing protein n=1 Tax=Extensimonas vulgaris TaxID=1031594 RepID=A0A369AKX3_9BURK|nr:RES family NAD+ phosphorylase [Extensimonas vulgaris]RCX08936.1 RES domain-containing protein [Extensimonas vulgaris]TWI34264.1 RES domain-containing protein [Extensimonas vulgaris]TXD14336.1 RES domain-containing protein [Extensimonas vulgaris]
MPTVWRITTARFAQSAFSGEGARAYGGRWNPKGWEVVYTAESQSLALLELMVQDEPLRAHYVLIPAQIPDDLAQSRIDADGLPADWRTLGTREVLQSLGLAWLKSARTAVLNVPSAVLPAERNYLLNPRHPDFARIVIGEPQSLQTDTRLLRNLDTPL